jgi:hypothetical protein
MVVTRRRGAPNVAPVKNAALFLCLLSGCATTSAPAEHPAAIGGAVGCFAQGIVAAADSGKGELIIAGIALMPLCAMLASSSPEPAYAPQPWVYTRMPKSKGLVSRK